MIKYTALFDRLIATHTCYYLYVKATTVRPPYYAPLYYADICYTRFFFLRKLLPPTISTYFNVRWYISENTYFIRAVFVLLSSIYISIDGLELPVMESVLYLSVNNRPIRLEAARGIIRQVLTKLELRLAA
jgi:hypothetical protein